MAYRDVVLVDTPVDYYEMETSTGTDSGSGSRTLTLNGGITTDVAGIIGDSWTFDGTNDYASMASFPSLTNAFSIEAWVKAPSAQGMTGDYHTVLRRDGTDIVLLRIRGSNITGNVNPGQAEVYIDGTTLVSGSSYRVDDGQWHHIVYTQAGNAAKLYVDGVQRATATTSQSTFNFGSGAGYIGAASGTSEFFKGTMDEVAVYNIALNSTRVAAHYNAAFGTNGGYTAQAMTASAATVDAVAQGNVRRVAVTVDRPTGTTATPDLYLKLPDPGLGTGETVGSAKLYVTPTATNVAYLDVYRVTSDFVDDDASTPTTEASAFINQLTSFQAGVAKEINLTSYYSSITYGVDVDAKTIALATSEHATTAYRPYVIYTIAISASVNPTADPITASAAMPEATVDATDTVSVGATPMTASAEAVEPDVETVSNLDVQPEPMEAQADMPGGGFSIPVSVSADSLEASVEVVDATVEVEVGPTLAATPMTATAVWKKPDLVNGNPIIGNESEDKYFQRVYAKTPKVWFRLNDLGSTAVDRMGGAGGVYHGVQVGRTDGPDDRHSVHFDGDAYIEQIETGGTNIDEAYISNGFTLEFSFKTSKSNTFLMVGRDSVATLTAQSPVPARELYLRDGKIAYRTHFFPSSQTGQAVPPVEFRGFKNLADNQWHHIVVKGYVDRFGEPGVEIWVDGIFEVRRSRFSNAGHWVGFPDFIGSRPDTIDNVAIDTLPSSLNFEGDMTEVVFYAGLVSDHEIARHYYDLMGWTPLEADPIEAFAFMPADARGKGNQKRALALYFKESEDAFSIGGDGFNGKMNFNPLVGWPTEFGGYKMFYKSVDDKNGQSYRDPVTDAPTLLSLKNDVDIHDYDVIMFKEWPDEGEELDLLQYFFPGALERLVEEIRWANDQGVGLFVTHPRLAVDLGIVDRVEFVPTLKDQAFSNAQGNAFGNYDYGSAVKFPWNIAASAGINSGSTGSAYNGQAMNTNPAFLLNKAFFYEDMNFNNKFRVRAIIEGLTDIPSYMIADAIYHEDFDTWGWQTSAFKYLHRDNGLQIGDEFIFHGTNPGGGSWGSWDYSDFRVGRPSGYFAVPLANVKAGTVVTTFGATHWSAQSQVDNPYRDYATTIVVRPGDTLKGKPVVGRIYVNFTEQPSRQPEAVAVQVLPENNADFPFTYNPDTPAQREWEWSGTRVSLHSTTPVLGGTITITLPDGSLATIPTDGAGGQSLAMTRSSQLFPIEFEASWQMNRRGLYWLGEAIEIDPGAATVAAEPMTATANVANPSIEAERDAEVGATPMAALVVMPKVAEDETGEVEVYTLPLTASATFTGFNRTVSAEPMTAVATLVENFDMVHASGEQVVLTLHGVDLVTLYLKEEE